MLNVIYSGCVTRKQWRAIQESPSRGQPRAHTGTARRIVNKFALVESVACVISNLRRER
jgi:hypothetical protein